MESRKNWDYTSSFYFTFVTLSTIGFGDMVAGDDDENEEAVWSVEKTCYRIFIIIWIIFGMGYIWGVVEVISKTLKKSGQPVVKIWKRIFEEIENDGKESSCKIDVIEKLDDILEKRNKRISVSLNDIGGQEHCPDSTEGLERDSLRSLKDPQDLMPKLTAPNPSQSKFRERPSSQLFQMRKASRSGQDLCNENNLNPSTAISKVFLTVSLSNPIKIIILAEQNYQVYAEAIFSTASS